MASPPAKILSSLRDFAKPCKGDKDLAVHVSNCPKKSHPEGWLFSDYKCVGLFNHNLLDADLST